MDHKAIRILLVEDDEEDYLLTRGMLQEIKFWDIDLDWVSCYQEALQAIGHREHDVYLIDYRLGEHDGLELLRRAVANGCNAPMILLTGLEDHEVDLAAMKAGAADFLTKQGIESRQLERSIRYAVEHTQALSVLRRLALGVESAGEAIAMTDIAGNIEYINPAFAQLTGYSSQEVIGQNPRLLNSGRHPRAVYTQMWDTILAGDTWSGQLTNRHKDGSHYEAQLTIAPVKDRHDQIQGFVAVHNNITPLKEAQAALEIANKELQNKNKKLTELTETAHRFVDNVAHDFRTPLTVIKEFSSIIADGLGGPVTDQQIEYLEFITTATRDLAQMVDDFLDSSKLKAGVLRIDRRPIQVSQIFDAVRPMLNRRAVSKKIRLLEEIEPDLKLVFVDSEKVGRVIVNLTVNAIKFSREGSDINLWAKAGDNGDVQIGITDYGPGLSPEDLAVIFERFKQVGDVQRSSTKGFGLGLNIAKELIWLNLGTVSVQSKIGRGSTFMFTLPPCDQSAILAHYFDRLAELDEPPVNMAVLRITPTDRAADPEEIGRFVSGVCYPMDLVLKSSGDQSIITIGSTNEPDLWVERLKKVRTAKVQQDSNTSLSALDVQCLSSLPYPQMKQRATSSTFTHLTELRLCA